MIPFFRKIRYKLAKDNQFLKYSRYAIGEIVLVVVGILIALQINNWNEERKQKKSEIQFLERLKSDLVKDNQYFSRRFNDSEKIVKLHYLFISKLYEEQKSMNDVRDLFQLAKFNSELLTNQNSTYNEMIYSGKLDLLSNESLKNDLVNYYQENEQVAKHVEEFNDFSVECNLQIIEHVPYLTRVMTTDWSSMMDDFYTNKHFEFNADWNFLNDFNSPKFQFVEQTIYVFGDKHHLFAEYFKKLAESSEVLVNSIQKELDQ